MRLCSSNVGQWRPSTGLLATTILIAAMTTEIGRKPKLNRKFISLEEKIKILDRLKYGEKLPAIAKKLNLNESTVRTIKRNENKIRATASTGSSVSLNRVVRIKDTLMPKMENCLMIWIEDCNQKNMPVNKDAIKRKALKIYTHLKELERVSSDEQPKFEFSASKGWFERFKNRFSLHNRKIHGERASADVEAAQKFPDELLKIIEEGGYTGDQVFNADETGLYWRKMPERASVSRNEGSVSEFEATKDRITLLLCSNASGDYVTKPMLINRSLNPRETKGLDKFKLPVYWRANKKAWVTGGVFNDWFFNCFVPEIENYTRRKSINFKVLLIVDNAPCHPRDLSHPNVKVIFLPFNTASIIQPLDQGIIKSLKLCYVRRTFEFILDKMDRDPGTTVTRFWQDFSIFNCVEILIASLKELKPLTLNACWKRIWPEVVTRESYLTPMPVEIDRVIHVARLLGGDGFEDMNEKDIYELIDNDRELDEEELVQLADESVSNVANNDDESSEETFDEPERNFTLKSLNEGLQLAKKLETHFAENDPSVERSAEFKRRLQECLAPYLEIQKELEANEEQLLIPEILIDTMAREDVSSDNENDTCKTGQDSRLEDPQPALKKQCSWNFISDGCDSDSN